MIVKTVGKSSKKGAQIWRLQCSSSSSLSSVIISLCDVSCCFPISISVAWSAGQQGSRPGCGGDLCWDLCQPHSQRRVHRRYFKSMIVHVMSDSQLHSLLSLYCKPFRIINLFIVSSLSLVQSSHT